MGRLQGTGQSLLQTPRCLLIGDFRAKSIWLSELVELGKSDPPGFYDVPELVEDRRKQPTISMSQLRSRLKKPRT
jgi:hypothetical protein